MQVPHLLLSLTIVKQDKSVEELQLELSKDELDSLLGSLAKARRVIIILAEFLFLFIYFFIFFVRLYPLFVFKLLLLLLDGKL